MAEVKKLTIQLHLVRHGETEANRDNILIYYHITQQGHCDYPLTELGIDQAVRRGIAIKDHDWGLVFSSDLYRAYNTTRIILQQQDAITEEFIKQSALLRELSFGVREGQSRSLTVTEAKAVVAKSRNIPVEDVHDQPESPASVRQRQSEFLTRLKYHCLEAMNKEQVNNKEKPFKVLCVAHGGFIGQFLHNFCPNILREKPKIGNCSLSIITIEWSHDEIPHTEDRVEMEVMAARNDQVSFTCTAHADEFNMCIE